LPATAARFGVVNAFNPAENIPAGVKYLKQLLVRYNDNEELALAAYNAGPLAVDRYGSQIPPYRETQDYVRRIGALRGTAPGAPGPDDVQVDGDDRRPPGHSHLQHQARHRRLSGNRPLGAWLQNQLR
jgi:hypothetical protein